MVPTTEFGLPSHQSHTDLPAPASVALCIAAMPPPFCTNPISASFCASCSSSGPGLLVFHDQDMFKNTSAS